MAPMEAARAHLDRLLAAHVPADEVERGHVAAVRALVSREPACFSRDTFAPGHLTASAFVVDDRGRLLLHHHLKLDRWLQMGGHDEGEHDPEKTARREAEEESGLTDLTLVRVGAAGLLDVDVHAIPARKHEPAHLHHDLRFLFVTRSPDAIRARADESLDLAFFSLEDAEAKLGEASARRVIAKITAALART